MTEQAKGALTKPKDITSQVIGVANKGMSPLTALDKIARGIPKGAGAAARLYPSAKKA